MARSIPVIYNQLLQQKAQQSELSDLNSTSQVSKWNLWLWITAAGQNLFEQLCDLFQANLETQIANAPVFTPMWIAQMCKLFQYSSTSPQVVQLIGSQTYPYLTIQYPVQNSSLCPVTKASVTSTTNQQLLIKVATGIPGSLVPLDGGPGTTGPIVTALVSYLNEVLTPDTHYVIINNEADQLFIQANVYYNASYSGVIKQNMDTAINNYLASIPFNGVVTVSDLEAAMLAVPGVNDIVLVNLFWREYTQTGLTGSVYPNNSFYNMQKLVDSQSLVYRNYQTIAGYVVAEQSSGFTIDDSIIYFPS